MLLQHHHIVSSLLMEDSSGRPSGIPRISRLPVARSASAIPKPSSGIPASSPARPAPSGNSQPANPSLRSHAPAKGRETKLQKATPRHETPLTIASSALTAQPSANNGKSHRRQTHLGVANKTGTQPHAPPASPTSNVADDSIAQKPPPATPNSSRPRLSLSERTVETLSLLPSSSSMSKSPAHFFDSSSSSTPASSHNSDGSSTSCNLLEDCPSPPSRLAAPPVTASPHSSHGSSTQRVQKYGRLLSRASIPSAMSQQISPEPMEQQFGASSQRGVKTMADRTMKPRTSINGLFRKPSLPALSRSVKDSATPKGTPLKPKQAQKTVTGGTRPTCPDDEALSSLKTRKSSAALRDQIAKAKAAKRAAARDVSPKRDLAPTHLETFPDTSGQDSGFDMACDDPFNLRRAEDANTKILKQRVASARTSGRLNIAALGLKTMPDEVIKMYDLETIGTYDGSWAESVDLTRLVAADNEFETLEDDLFPDSNQETLGEDSDGQGNMFGGLETMDLHGNLLVRVPPGFRCLVYMTSLNLSSNRLDNDCLDILTQLTGLRELKLSKNRLCGPLSLDISKLEALEILDLHGNAISELPNNFGAMSRLRILNLNDNRFKSLSFNSLSAKSLTELSVKKNQLGDVLIKEQIDSLPMLQMLDASSNQLTHLVAPGSRICLPAIHTLSLSVNKLQELPDVTTWTSLLTLKVDENGLSDFPVGFTGLDKLRHADFACNNIRIVPLEISRMDSLSMFRLTGNPLRDRKLLSATTEELKEILAGRLEPPPPYQESGSASDMNDLMERLVEMETKRHVADVDDGDAQDRSDADEDFATPPTSAPRSPVQASSQVWLVKAGGVLDRSETNMSELSTRMCIDVAAQHSVQQVQLQHNRLACIPTALSVFAGTLTYLSLAHNKLAGQLLLQEELELPVLREMDLASNQMTCLEVLAQLLRAPALDKVDVSFNGITRLPSNLKQAFPQLQVLLAANNQLTALEAKSISGLRTVNVANNEIAHLSPLIGLLGGKGGLEKLDVTGNRFKIPRWNILERGTDETLRWLRGRVPAADIAAWKEANGQEGDEDGCY
ncbi:hypothetical protein CDD81_6990 [Ophiocordyceps australis]|uniref:Leucine-rich repeat-containing protein 40 n=1 Tax=Ophiocordyceps australis TaxID=1399860 RepID=A0A2C5YAI7_9HYPO|nr:hypothetical protein CDD81_6990 [Ophiocordyceps australis]